jgi:hypothetical protein
VLRLNQPILQTLNQLLGPLQLALILVYVRAGEWLWRAAPVPLSIPTLATAFRDDPWAFLQRFGWTGVHAATAWIISVPVIVAALYYPLRPVMRRLRETSNCAGGERLKTKPPSSPEAQTAAKGTMPAENALSSSWR